MATKRPAEGGSIGRRSMNRSEFGRLHLFSLHGCAGAHASTLKSGKIALR